MRFFEKNCAEFGIELFDVLDQRQGIEHVIAPEQGFILPGMVVAAGDSHTTTYGALGALGFGIGTSDIEHYLATQTLVYQKLKTMRISVEGRLLPGVTAKDVVMAVIRRIGAAGAVGYAVEFAGSAIAELSVEGRMTICNMIVEGGARGVIMAPDEKVFDYLKGRPRAPTGAAWDQAVAQWRDAAQRRTGRCSIARFGSRPKRSSRWSPGAPARTRPCRSAGSSPIRTAEPDAVRKHGMRRALDYMGIAPGTKVSDIAINVAFIGSCTNARIEDLRDAAAIIRRPQGRRRRAGDGGAGLDRGPRAGGDTKASPRLSSMPASSGGNPAVRSASR